MLLYHEVGLALQSINVTAVKQVADVDVVKAEAGGICLQPLL